MSNCFFLLGWSFEHATSTTDSDDSWRMLKGFDLLFDRCKTFIGGKVQTIEAFDSSTSEEDPVNLAALLQIYDERSWLVSLRMHILNKWKRSADEIVRAIETLTCTSSWAPYILYLLGNTYSQWKDRESLLQKIPYWSIISLRTYFLLDECKEDCPSPTEYMELFSRWISKVENARCGRVVHICPVICCFLLMPFYNS